MSPVNRFGCSALAGIACVGTLFAAALPALSQQGTTLVIASYGGQLDDTYRRALKGFEEKFNVTVRMVPGTSAENAAKIAATKANPEYDLAFLENFSHDTASRADALASVDESIVTNYKDLSPLARLPKKDGIPVGFFVAGIFYNAPEFAKRGWAAPTSWDDLFRPELCKSVGVLHPNVSYGMHMLLMLSGGDTAKIQDGIARLGKLKNCIATLEPSASKFEEKMQLGEYLIGVHGSIRALPLIQQGYPIKYIVPKEGSILGSSIAVPVKNAKNARLAQEALNALISPEAQTYLMETAFYAPTNAKVEVTPAMQALGLPDRKTMERVIQADYGLIAEKRREWVRLLEREMAR